MLLNGRGLMEKKILLSYLGLFGVLVGAFWIMIYEYRIVTGEIDLLVKVAVKDIDALNAFIIQNLRDIEGVEKTVTSVVLSDI